MRMMRGIEVAALRFRQLRKARRLTQQELARLAGASERTVRNAEAGQRVRQEFLDYLAAALGVDLLDVVQEPEELQIAKREQANVSHLLSALEAFAYDRDLTALRSLMVKCVLAAS
jgi:transcriptional regulator with XRE-family HTH domain